MGTQGRLAQIRRQKQQLIEQCDQERRAIQEHFDEIEASLAWLGQLAEIFQATRDIWTAVQPIVDSFTTRRRRFLSWVSKGFLAWQTYQKGRALWQKRHRRAYAAVEDDVEEDEEAA